MRIHTEINNCYRFFDQWKRLFVWYTEVYTFFRYDATANRTKSLELAAVTHKGLIPHMIGKLPVHGPYPSLDSNFVALSERWVCEGDETKVEETHGQDGMKSEGSKGKELVEEEENEDPKEDPEMDIPMVTGGNQPMDASDESNFLKFLMGDTKSVYSSSSSCKTVESQGSNPSSDYPSSSARLQSGKLSGIWSSPHAPSE
ncbi:hypothetical protein PIB30_055717 [Stylosanthes scabra]|uniref:Uncharacterized protein n=1 Tax=Stylosanthes scabra TaxID=79078 RepID=A0ABU6XJU1_9FABA|nr:hypothetical protein [Stylosanthes scabra]